MELFHPVDFDLNCEPIRNDCGMFFATALSQRSRANGRLRRRAGCPVGGVFQQNFTITGQPGV
jgi:hypothetical protein